MNSYLTIELYALKQNLASGVQLALFRKSAFGHFRIGFDHAVFLILFNFSLLLLGGYVKYLPQPEFNVYGVTGFCFQIIGLLMVAFILAKLARDNGVALCFIVLTSSLTPFFYIVGAILAALSARHFIYYGLGFWALLSVGLVLHHYLDRRVTKTLVSLGVYGVCVISPSYYINSGEMWYPKIAEDDYYSQYANMDEEKLFYQQFDHLNALQRNLLPGRPYITDLYFLGFGGYSTENVFMNEIQHIQSLMDREYDTRGRSVALINNPKTVNDTPLATVSNLNRALVSIGQAMNKEEDVLFLYLTSHGSRKELSVSFWPLQLNQVTPEGLRQALDEAGIKWRIILISACYSGGFLEPLKNDNTIIMTAAAKDRTSFGCGSKSDFTYFGNAVFKEQLTNNHSFINAFENAKASIEKRENREHLKHSNPQLSVGINIRDKLDQLEHELNVHYRRENTYGG